MIISLYISNGVSVGFYVGNGAVRLIKSPGENEDVFYCLSGIDPGPQKFNWRGTDTMSPHSVGVIKQLDAIYGSVVTDNHDAVEEITLYNVTFTTDDFKVPQSLAENFELAGLFEGVTQIYDEEGSSLIANGIWCNGVLYIPTTVEGDIERACLGTFYVAEAKLNDPLSSMVKAETGVFYGSAPGITYADLVDILSESGLTIKPIDCSNQVQNPTTLPGLKSQCDTTQLWLNG